jgi:hypothetical protein
VVAHGIHDAIVDLGVVGLVALLAPRFLPHSHTAPVPARVHNLADSGADSLVDIERNPR